MTNIENLLDIKLPSPLQPIVVPEPKVNGPIVFAKRDDLIHPIISGNKWRKLQRIINHFELSKYDGIVSFGGGYSNHLHALGYVCRQLNIPFTACVRGNYSHNLTPMLADLNAWQSQICWLTKVEYRQKAEPDFIERVCPQLHNHLLVPEGGSGQQALDGMQQLINELPENITHIVCPVASGGTIAGLVQAAFESQRKIEIVGIAVLAGEGYLEDLVADIVTQPDCLTAVEWQILHQYHCGGYAKSTQDLSDFCGDFTCKTGIPVEPVYSGKLFFALTQLLKNDFFPLNANICALHTGGLQGAR